MNDTLTLVILRNGGRALEGWLRELRRDCPALLVVDDASTDETSLVLRDLFAIPVSKRIPDDGFFALYHEERKGRFASLLDGIELARAAGYAKLVLVRKTSRRSFVLKGCKPSSFWWRLRTRIGTI